MRWFVRALLFAIVALNYADRRVLSVLKPTLQQAYGWMAVSFQIAYGLGYVAFGRIVDRFGAKVHFQRGLGFGASRTDSCCRMHRACLPDTLRHSFIREKASAPLMLAVPSPQQVPPMRNCHAPQFDSVAMLNCGCPGTSASK